MGMYAASGGGGIGDLARHLVLPGFVMVIQLLGTFVKQTRGSMLEVMNEEYVKTARAKGLSELRGHGKTYPAQCVDPHCFLHCYNGAAIGGRRDRYRAGIWLAGHGHAADPVD